LQDNLGALTNKGYAVAVVTPEKEEKTIETIENLGITCYLYY